MTQRSPDAPSSPPEPVDEETTAAILEAASLLVVVVDRDGQILRWSAACERATGFRAEEVVGRSVWELIPEDELASVEAVFQELRDEGRPNLHENDWWTRDGRRRRIAWSNTVIQDPDGGVHRVIGTGIDVTELRASETRRRLSESRLAGIVESAMDAIVTVDESQRVVLFNPAAEKMFGRRRDDVIGRPLDILLPERFRNAHRGHVSRFVTSGATSRRMGQLGRVWGVRADGEEFPIEASISQTGSESGSLLTVILRDITDHERAAEAERLLAGIVRSSDDAILATDLEGRILSWNPAAEQIYGSTRETALGSDLVALVAPERHEELESLLKKVREGRGAGHLETLGVRGDEERFELSLGVSPRRDATGRAVGLSVIARDNSAYRRLERKLRQTEEFASVATLIAGIAHDIGSPMNVILGYTRMLERSLREKQNLERLHIVQEQVQRVVRLIQKLLNFARPQKENPVPLEVEKILDDTLGLISETARERRIAIERDFAGAAAIRAKKERLERAFLNLFVNAVDAMPDGGSLRISTRELPDGVEIRVRDTGIGMSKEALARIFEPFYTTKARGQGTGLGLLVTRGIFREHGGSIRVRSEVGEGTEFYVWLPRESAAEEGDEA